MKSLFITAAICIGLIGCSDDSKDAARNIRNEPDLQGTFTDIRSSSKILGASEKIQLKFEGNKYTRSQIFYGEFGCENETGRIEYTGEFKAGKQNQKNPSQSGTLDLNVEEAKVKVSTDGLATALNAVNYCGHRDFAKGKEITLSGKQTQGLCPIENVPVQLYTIYKIEGDRLYLGDLDITTMAGDENSRSDTVLFDKIYVRGSDGKVAAAKKDADKTLDEAKSDVKKTANEAESDAKKTAEEAKSDVKKTVNEAESDVKKTVDQAKTDAKQAADKADQKVQEQVNDRD